MSANRPSTVAAIDVKGVVRAWAKAMAEHSPDGLGPSELRLDREPLTRSPVAVPVFAWVRYGGIRAIERLRLASLVDANLEIAGALHAPEFVLVHPSGGTWTKELLPRRHR